MVISVVKERQFWVVISVVKKRTVLGGYYVWLKRVHFWVIIRVVKKR